ncbi:ran-binding protein 3 isoform X6 [Parasteatoda tepidariorum]|uniref:ran-binding protein 3 isoform X6 n=1 Tax=Parasteatoda tepidariorum TaxID=114398 RepID=UPI0039BC8642
MIFAMADEGASSSSNSVDEVDGRIDSQPLSNSTSSPDTDNCVVVSSSSQPESVNQVVTSNAASDGCTVVSSSSHMGGASQGIVRMSRLSYNPFAIKTSIPTRSVADSTDNKETRPIVAPPTLKLGNSDSCGISTSLQDSLATITAPKIVLRPSALSMQAEKLKLFSTKQDGKENSDENNIAKDQRNSTNESNGKISKAELFASGIAAASESSSPLKSSAAEGSFCSPSKSSEEQSTSNGGFIFGQNLHERVLNYEAVLESPASPSDAHNITFEEAALKKEELEKMEQQNQEEKLKSLSESAKEYESKQVKRKFEEVAVITGEEEESNVLQINCKLFAFDKIGMNWLERGRGILRLNDRECNGSLHSRVVMRTRGSLRVVLNTKVWAGMSVEHPSVKTVRLTAYDPQGVKVFLVMAQPNDTEQLYQALNWRVTSLKAQEGSEGRQSRVEEATSSSNLPDGSAFDDSTHSPPSKLHATDPGDYGADSSSETNFVIHHESSREAALGGNADSTDVQS